MDLPPDPEDFMWILRSFLSTKAAAREEWRASRRKYSNPTALSFHFHYENSIACFPAPSRKSPVKKTGTFSLLAPAGIFISSPFCIDRKFPGFYTWFVGESERVSGNPLILIASWLEANFVFVWRKAESYLLPCPALFQFFLSRSDWLPRIPHPSSILFIFFGNKRPRVVITLRKCARIRIHCPDRYRETRFSAVFPVWADTAVDGSAPWLVPPSPTVFADRRTNVSGQWCEMLSLPNSMRYAVEKKSGMLNHHYFWGY